MPLILTCGLPCSGKTTVARAIVDHMSSHPSFEGRRVVVVNEESLHLRRGASLADPAAEKMHRASLKSACDRALNARDVVILDSGNFIKGYRYQMWTEARAAATTMTVVLVDTPLAVCKAWNNERMKRGGAGKKNECEGGGDREDGEKAERESLERERDTLPEEFDSYTEAEMDDLAGRFERPNPATKWDKNCVVVGKAGEKVKAGTGGDTTTSHSTFSSSSSTSSPSFDLSSLYVTVNDPKDQERRTGNPDGDDSTAWEFGIPFDEIVAAVLSTAVPKESFATEKKPLTGANTLHEIDRDTQAVVKAALAMQSSGVRQGAVPGCKEPLRLTRQVTPHELRRMRSEFLNRVRINPLEFSGNITELFVHHVNRGLQMSL